MPKKQFSPKQRKDLDEDSNSTGDILTEGLSFNSLINASSTHGSHFQFKSEKSWMSNDCYSKGIDSHFHLNVTSLTNNILSIPFAKRLNMYNSSSSIMSDTKTAARSTFKCGMFNEDISLVERLNELDEKVARLLRNDDSSLEEIKLNHDIPTTVASVLLERQVKHKIAEPLNESCIIDDVQESPKKNPDVGHDLEDWLDSILDE